MKVYIVQTSSGSYEDYRSYIDKIFLNEKDASTYTNQYNSDLKTNLIKARQCNDCSIYCNIEYDEVEIHELDQWLKDNKFSCPRNELKVSPYDFQEKKLCGLDCWLDYNRIFDEHSATYKEYEVIV